MTIIRPDEAFKLAQAGKVAELLKSKISSNFSWGEVFDEDLVYIATVPQSVFLNASKQANTMECVRELFGKSIIVHCWYRTPEHNAQVGGAKNSQHLLGLATDFHVEGFEGVDGNRLVQKRLNVAPFMSLRGLEYTGGGWTHVDSRSLVDGRHYGYRFNPNA